MLYYFLLSSKVNQLYIYIHPLTLESSPIQAITEYCVEFPMLYSRSLLAIYFIYKVIYILYIIVSICWSQSPN